MKGEDLATTRASDPWVGYVQRRSRLRGKLASDVGKIGVATVILGGLFALMTAGGDGNPHPGQSTSSIFAPHSAAGLSVALFVASLGVLVAVARIAIYVVQASRLARKVKDAVRRDVRQAAP